MDARSARPEQGDCRSLALPRFLDISKSVALSHAEISALYFVVEDHFEVQIESADPAGPIDEARALTQLLRGIIDRWNRAEPAGICADLIDLPWEEPERGD